MPNGKDDHMKTDAIRVTHKLDEIPVVMEMEDGSERHLVLREMHGTGRDAYLQSMAGRMRTDAKGNIIGVKNFDGLQASLLSKCLYDEVDELVSVKEIQAFPTKAVITLFKAAQKLNGLEQDAEDDAKND